MMALFLPCFCAAILSAILISAMIRVGVLDIPGHRSSHTTPVPKGGGIGIIIAFLIVFPLQRLIIGGASLELSLIFPLLAVAVLSLFSWLDDIHSYRASAKLGMQSLAACLVLAGLHPSANISGSELELSAFYALAFVWLLYVTNAINFIDGINGLASGAMLISAVSLGLLFMHAGMSGDTEASFILAACLAAFIPFNFPKARSFMGDVGSQGAALTLGWLGLQAALHTSHPLILIFLLFSILFDVAFTLIRRLFAGDRLAEAHRGHLYQLAVRSGLPPVIVTVIYWSATAWGGIIYMQDCSLTLRILLLLAPQLVWMAIVIRKARNTSIGRW